MKKLAVRIKKLIIMKKDELKTNYYLRFFFIDLIAVLTCGD